MARKVMLIPCGRQLALLTLLSDPDMVDLRCMCFSTKGTTEILVAGCQSQMFRLDVETGTIIEKVSINVEVGGM